MDSKKIKQDYNILYALMCFCLIIAFVAVGFMVEGIITSSIYFIAIPIIVLCILLYACIVFSIRIHKLSKALKVSKIIFKEGSVSKIEIADKLKISLDEVDARMNFLENHNYIPNCTITDGVIETDEYRMRKHDEKKKDVIVREMAKQEAEKEVSKTSGECSNCGARVVFQGDSTLCPYCNTVVKSEK